MNAMHLLENNKSKINWFFLSRNINAISLSKKHLHKLDWKAFSRNMNALDVMMKNQSFILWHELSLNPNIFMYDYAYYEDRIDVYREELMKNVSHYHLKMDYVSQSILF